MKLLDLVVVRTQGGSSMVLLVTIGQGSLLMVGLKLDTLININIIYLIFGLNFIPLVFCC